MKKYLAFFFILISFSGGAQNKLPFESKPKLVIGIVVDQMREDYLYKYWDEYSAGGFKRLVNNGYVFNDANFNYYLTVTGAGHSTVYTGTTPSIHGIVDNNWFDRNTNKEIYCVTDSSVHTIGNPSQDISASPKYLRVSTVTDELKLSNQESKVISIALKDRSAVLPGGHLSNGTYWFDTKSGTWITSTFYTQKLPDWAKDFNKSKVEDYTRHDWELLNKQKDYHHSYGDSLKYKNTIPGESQPVFPHKIGKGNYNVLPYTPFGSTMTKDMAIAAIQGEDLGKRKTTDPNTTDFLCISFSSPDYIGHTFGINSIELEDCYLRLDLDLQSFLDFLDKYIGMQNVLIFLTADHGACLTPAQEKDLKMEGGAVNTSSLTDSLNALLAGFYGSSKLISDVTGQMIYLNYAEINTEKLKAEDVAQHIQQILLRRSDIQCVMSPKFPSINTCTPEISSLMWNSYLPFRSGDILFSIAPGYADWISPRGTSHGTAFSYDRHVPVLFFGWNIAAGSSNRPVSTIDIAPTISNWLGIPFPSGCQGHPMTEEMVK